MKNLLSHPNNIARALGKKGYTLQDVMAAYPGRTTEEVDTLLRDSAYALVRPVLKYGLLGIRPCSSNFFNVSPFGFRSNGTPQVWPPDSETLNVFCFGGSTTVGFNIADNETIPAYLQDALRAKGLKCEVYNFGSGNYSSRHEFLRFLGLIDDGYVPHFAVFLDGYNDSVYAFGNTQLVNFLDEIYRQERTRRQQSLLRATWDYFLTRLTSKAAILPSSEDYKGTLKQDTINKYLSDVAIEEALTSSSRTTAPNQLDSFTIDLGSRVWESYLTSVMLSHTLAQRTGVKVLFAWQPVPFFATEEKHRVVEDIFKVFRFGALSWHMYQWLDSTTPQFPFPNLWVNLADRGLHSQDVLYVDVCHYSAPFAKRLGTELADEVYKRIGPEFLG